MKIYMISRLATSKASMTGSRGAVPRVRERMDDIQRSLYGASSFSAASLLIPNPR